MDTAPRPLLADHFAAALDWWREAGVDCDFHDEARALLDAETAAAQAAEETPAPRPARSRPAVTETAPRIMLGGDRADWPAKLADFAPWWLGEPTLDPAPPATRVAPQGAAGADLMVLVTMPEAEDREVLLSGPQGRLLAGMLRAMGIAPDAAYIASALPRHTPLADWAGLAAAGLGEVLHHHIALAAPRRLMVLGQDVLPLLGLEKRQDVRELPVNGANLPLFAAVSLENLLGSAQQRAALWRRWLEWTSNA